MEHNFSEMVQQHSFGVLNHALGLFPVAARVSMNKGGALAALSTCRVPEGVGMMPGGRWTRGNAHDLTRHTPGHQVEDGRIHSDSMDAVYFGNGIRR